MLKKLLPVVLIVLAFNFLIYTIWEKPKTKELPPTAQKTLEALSIPMVDDPLTALSSINGSDVHWTISLKSGQIVGWSCFPGSRGFLPWGSTPSPQGH